METSYQGVVTLSYFSCFSAHLWFRSNHDFKSKAEKKYDVVVNLL